MKKLVLLLIILAGCAKLPIQETPVKTDRSASVALTNINVGASANDGSGQTIRSAFQTVNSNNDAIEAFAATVPTEAEVSVEIADSNNARIAAALELSDYAFMMADSNDYGGATTYNGMINYVASHGGSEGGGYEWTSFIVGTTTGSPANADTSFTISDMAGDVIELYRGTTADLHKEWLNETATNGKTGYRYNSSGTVVVRPAWATDDRAYIKAVPSSAVTKIVLSGGESTLLTGLRAAWKMDEAAGTQVNDELDTYHGTTNAVVAQAGKFGYSHQFIKANADRSAMGTTVGDVGTSDFSLACWIYIPDASANEFGIMGNWGQTPYYYIEYNLQRIIFYFSFGGGDQEVTSNAVNIAEDTWIHVCVTVDRSGNATLYLDGVAQTDVEDVSADVSVAGNNNAEFNIGSVGNNNVTIPFNGYIDDAFIWLKVLTQDEINELLLNTYPF